MATKHESVLTAEVINGLGIVSGDIVVDATLGAGGHSLEIAKTVPGVRLIGFDADLTALAGAKKRIERAGYTIELVHENFRNIGNGLEKLGLSEVQRILFDLGWSSDQLESSGRGFSFLRDEPLLMTLTANPGPDVLTAKDIVNEFSVDDLTNILLAYGEERFARKIAKAICEKRIERPIETTYELAALIDTAVPIWYRVRRIHPATKTFQALRVAVNDELEALAEGLKEGWQALAPKGRMAVIAFHSLEDRIVKNFFREKASEGGVLIAKKPITPTQEEVKRNPRSRSAKLRIIEKL